MHLLISALLFDFLPCAAGVIRLSIKFVLSCILMNTLLLCLLTCSFESGKLAKRRAQLLKEKRIRLLEEAYARKLQSRYRAHLAKRKVGVNIEDFIYMAVGFCDLRIISHLKIIQHSYVY